MELPRHVREALTLRTSRVSDCPQGVAIHCSMACRGPPSRLGLARCRSRWLRPRLRRLGPIQCLGLDGDQRCSAASEASDCAHRATGPVNDNFKLAVCAVAYLGALISAKSTLPQSAAHAIRSSTTRRATRQDDNHQQQSPPVTSTLRSGSSRREVRDENYRESAIDCAI